MGCPSAGKGTREFGFGTCNWGSRQSQVGIAVSVVLQSRFKVILQSRGSIKALLRSQKLGICWIVMPVTLGRRAGVHRPRFSQAAMPASTARWLSAFISTADGWRCPGNSSGLPSHFYNYTSGTGRRCQGDCSNFKAQQDKMIEKALNKS